MRRGMAAAASGAIHPASFAVGRFSTPLRCRSGGGALQWGGWIHARARAFGQDANACCVLFAFDDDAYPRAMRRRCA